MAMEGTRLFCVSVNTWGTVGSEAMGVGGLCTPSLRHRHVGNICICSGSMPEQYGALSFVSQTSQASPQGSQWDPELPDNWHSFSLQSHSQISYSANPYTSSRSNQGQTR